MYVSTCDTLYDIFQNQECAFMGQMCVMCTSALKVGMQNRVCVNCFLSYVSGKQCHNIKNKENKMFYKGC